MENFEQEEVQENFLPQEETDHQEDAEQLLSTDDESGEEQEKPPGYKTFDEYVADGGDPEMYRGPKAYTQFKELKQQTSDKIHKVEEQMAELVKMQREQIEKAKADAHAQAMQELQGKMATAKENLDFEAYEQASSEMQKMQSSKPEDNTQRLQSVVAEIKQSLPLINETSAEYNPAFFSVVQTNLGQVMESNNVDTNSLTPEALKHYMNEALERSKKDMPHLFRQPRKAPHTAAPKSGKPQGGSLFSRLEKSDQAMYQTLAKSDKKTAEEFARLRLGE